MKRWPRWCRPPSGRRSRGHDLAPASSDRRQRIDRSGRTQRSAPAPQRIDFGQGKSRMVRSSTSATISAPGGRAFRSRRRRPRPSCRRAPPAGRASGRSTAGSPRSPSRARRCGGPCAPRAGRAFGQQPLDRQRQPAGRGEGGGMGVGQPASTSPSVTRRAGPRRRGPASGRGFPRRGVRSGDRASLQVPFGAGGQPSGGGRRRRRPRRRR
jgi:hypothetical protein